MQESGASKLKLDVDEQLAKLLENQKLAKKEEREYTEEERRIKQQILLQYSQVSILTMNNARLYELGVRTHILSDLGGF